MIAALAAMTTERNAAVSSRNATATTTRISRIMRLLIWVVKSTLPGVVPVTYVVAWYLGSTSARRVATRSVVAVACGRVVGTALNTATVDALFTDAGDTEATPAVPATPLPIELSSDWSAELDCLGSLTTTVSGPLAPTPNPWLIRS